MAKQETCLCDARKFPHRKGELLCAELAEQERNEKEANEQYYLRRGLRTRYQRAMHDSGHREADFL